jgi:hypothetical protein
MCKVKKVLNINKQNNIICYEQGVQLARGSSVCKVGSWQGEANKQLARGQLAMGEFARGSWQGELAVGLVARNEVSWQRG